MLGLPGDTACTWGPGRHRWGGGAGAQLSGAGAAPGLDPMELVWSHVWGSPNAHPTHHTGDDVLTHGLMSERGSSGILGITAAGLELAKGCKGQR